MSLMAVKILVGFFTLFLMTKLLGKTSINQLTPFHFIFALVLGELLGNSIYEDKIKLVHFLFAAGLWTSCLWGVERLTQRKKSTRAFWIGNPDIVIRDGIIDRNVLLKNKLDVNQLLSLLRQSDVFSVREVKYGILEPNGTISVLRKSMYQKPNKLDLNLPQSPVNLPITLIIDGEVLWDNLQQRGFDQLWLKNQLRTHGFDDEKGVFYAEWRDGEGIHISPKIISHD